MKSSVISRLTAAGIVVAVITLTALVVVTAKAQSNEGEILCSGLSGSAGMVMDSRRNVYTADRATGYVFCLPPGGDPVLYAKVPGTPTALAVDMVRTVFVSTQSGMIYRIARNGRVEEAYLCDASPVGLGVDRDGGLIIMTDDGVVMKVDRNELLSGQ